MIIELKQKHINEGERESPCNCALARAFKEALGIDVEANSTDHTYVEVDDDEVVVRSQHERLFTFKTPRNAARLIAKFDGIGKKAVKPGVFKFVPVREEE